MTFQCLQFNQAIGKDENAMLDAMMNAVASSVGSWIGEKVEAGETTPGRAALYIFLLMLVSLALIGLLFSDTSLLTILLP